MFELVSDYKPTGDQPEAIKELVQGIEDNSPYQTLLGVTGSGKTFTIANVVKEIQKPTLVMSHNKTLAAQLYSEFKKFFPNNAVEYYVSYYDYYQPEAYLPTTDTYIEKDLSINSEIEKLRLSTMSSLLSGRKDILVVASVSCIYGVGNPEDFEKTTVHIEKGQMIDRDVFLRSIVDILYSRNEVEFNHGNFRVKGDTIDIFLAYADDVIRIGFWGDEIDSIEIIDPVSGLSTDTVDDYTIFPANLFVTSKDKVNNALHDIMKDMNSQVEYFNSIDKRFEAKRIFERVNYDMEMMREVGHCSGIENYSRYFDGRKPGEKPYCLLDFFPKDFLLVIDESHVSLPQIRAMWGGDHARKQNLVEYGFRLPAAMDNRPLTFSEFESFNKKTIYVSATPGDYELEKSEGVIVEQIIRPTGLLDPPIEVRPTKNQIDDLLEEIQLRSEKDERVLITTLTKKMAEELTTFLLKANIRCSYIHSDVDTMDRIQIMSDLRNGLFDVLVGVNLLREGLDLPEVSLVAILDADKEGFLRNYRSMTQTAGRAARNLNGKVIMYADKMTESMRRTISETQRRRKKQMEYNTIHNITPTAILKAKGEALAVSNNNYQAPQTKDADFAEPIMSKMTIEQLEKTLESTKNKMRKAAKKMDFTSAAQYRNEMFKIEDILNSKRGHKVP